MPIYVTDILPPNNLITFGGDNLVTFQGDNLVAATDGNPDLIEELYVGNVVINRVYVGADLVHERDQTQVLTLTSDIDVNLSTWLGTQAADPTKPIIINFADGQIIGGTVDEAPALNLGDLSAYTGGITFNMDGQVQGKQGYDALWAQDDIDILNAGEIAGNIIGALSPSALIVIVVSATGKILAGGGNGGNGGKGGNGESFQRKAEVHSYVYDYDQYAFSNGVYWSGSYKGIGGGTGLRSGNYWYTTDDGPTQAQGSRYAPGRGPITAGIGGAGGLGGVGAGYTQAQTIGADGASGTNRSGNGGAGGNGGDWGVDGGSGSSGASGLYVTGTNPSAVRAGAPGQSGTSAGNAIVSMV